MEHHVYFWLKDEFKTENGYQKMEEALTALATSPNISRAKWGKPAKTAERPVTDHSWDYGISFYFETLIDHDRYQNNDPIHDQFSAENAEMWAKVLVMDLD